MKTTLFVIALDVADPNDLGFQEYMFAHGILTQPTFGDEVLFIATTRATLVKMIDDMYNDGSGDLSHVYDAIIERKIGDTSARQPKRTCRECGRRYATQTICPVDKGATIPVRS